MKKYELQYEKDKLIDTLSEFMSDNYKSSLFFINNKYYKSEIDEYYNMVLYPKLLEISCELNYLIDINNLLLTKYKELRKGK